MRTIFLFFWNLMKLIIQTDSKPSNTGTACLGLIFSFEAHVVEKRSLSILPDRQFNNETLQQGIPQQKRPQRNPNAEWQAWCENNRMLFQSTA
ncbi:hypothetical protein L1N85_06420 [Paenibacillus alkaliterrae]|uniref:hypothetical protein n=1 Tax=Paenibacillus alkaliterrae TaxID=320909 RepID=UPI001F1FF49F|nr:hypothetical protein [Paenibacillus alkaliterrae]MCF2938065.1 hypothetical protein [Paenibacillus alkaliterrae]